MQPLADIAVSFGHLIGGDLRLCLAPTAYMGI